MQKAAFAELLQKYGDTETNPGAEGPRVIWRRLRQPDTTFFFILCDGKPIGAIRVVRMGDGYRRLATMFILPSCQGHGYAQAALALVEARYPEAGGWRLDTLGEEPKLRHLYEKVGYRLTGETETVRPGMTLVFYEKRADAGI